MTSFRVYNADMGSHIYLLCVHDMRLTVGRMWHTGPIKHRSASDKERPENEEWYIAS